MAAQRIKRHKGCGLCRPTGWRGQGPARKLPMRDLRRLGMKRRLNVRRVTEREQRMLGS